MACLFKFCIVTKADQEEGKPPNIKHLCSFSEMTKSDVNVSSSHLRSIKDTNYVVKYQGHKLCSR